MVSKPSFLLCFCPDGYLLRLHIKALLATWAPNKGQTWQTHTFWGDEPLPQIFWEHLALVGLFADYKVLLIRNAQNIKAEELRKLSEGILSHSSPTTWPILCFENEFDRGKPKVASHIQKLPCYTQAEKHGWLDTIEGLTVRNLPNFIQKEAAQIGLILKPIEITSLTELLPPNARAASAELQKLALASPGDGKLPHDWKAIVSYTPESNIFTLLQQIETQGKSLAAWHTIIEDSLRGDTMLFAFLATLHREARILWQLFFGDEVFLPPQVRQQKNTLAKRLGVKGIAKIWEIGLVAEKGVKSGERSPDQAFETAVADLFTLLHNQK